MCYEKQRLLTKRVNSNLLLLSASLFGLALYTYAVPIGFIGFPDGHITDFGYVQKRLYQVHMGLSVIFGGLFFGLSLGHFPNPKRFMRSSWVLVILYLILTASLIAIGYYYSLHLDDGIGG